MAIPVTLADARRQVRLDEADTSLDTQLQEWIDDAAAWVEKYTGHILVQREVTETFRAAARAIELKAWPIATDALPTVTGSDGTPFVDTRFFAGTRPARLTPSRGSCWPLTASDEIVTVTISAGYADDDVVPGNFRRAMLVLISAYDSDREGGEVFQAAEATARRLCRDYRLIRI